MVLKHYIKHQHGGNVSAFARMQGVAPSQVERWLKKNCLIKDGVVYCEVVKNKRKDK